MDDSSGDFGDVEMVSAERHPSVNQRQIWMFCRKLLLTKVSFKSSSFSRRALEHSGKKHTRHVCGFFFEDVFADGWDP